MTEEKTLERKRVDDRRENIREEETGREKTKAEKKELRKDIRTNSWEKSRVCLPLDTGELEEDLLVQLDPSLEDPQEDLQVHIMAL